MKKISFALLFSALLFSATTAQENDSVAVNLEAAHSAAPQRIIPRIKEVDFVKMKKIATFDASDSELIDRQFGLPTFYWEFSDEFHRWGNKVTRTFHTPGRYWVRLVVKQGSREENRVSARREFTVYNRQIAWISDDIEKHESLSEQAGKNGIRLLPIPFDSEKTGFAAEEALMRRTRKHMPFLREADALIFQTKSAQALQSFAQIWQKISEDISSEDAPGEVPFDPQNKLWVQLSDAPLDQIVKLAQPTFSIVRPKFLLLTRWEALAPVFENLNDFEALEKVLHRYGIDFRIVDERTATSRMLIFSRLTTYFASHGIPQNDIYLLLAVPFLAFVIAFFRQFVGISTFGVYAPLMLGLSFLVLGLAFGFLVFMMVLFISYLIRILFEKVDLLYIPKVSLLLSALALSFFLVLGLAVYFETSVNLTLAIFPMLVMATISEKFLSAQSEEGMKNALFATAETTLVSLVGYALVTWIWLKSLILSLPELVVLPILGNIWLGRFSGLRLSEYFKFRTLFRDDASEE